LKLSVIIPTHRTSYSALARILECASLDPAKFEVIVRDNSEDAAKKSLLEHVGAPAMRLAIARNRGPFENLIQAFHLASGDFVCFLADDDWVSKRGLDDLHDLAAEYLADSTVACLTGTYVMETFSGSGLFRYPPLDSLNASERLNSFLLANGPNALFYSVVRRAVADFSLRLLEKLPYHLSFHDQLVSLLYLALGRTLQIERFTYWYDLGQWDTLEKSVAKDRAMYVAAGWPAEIDRLHWLLCGLEGALLLNSQLLKERSSLDCAHLSNAWFSSMFTRFVNQDREFGLMETPTNSASASLKRKWLAEPSINSNELLLDICDVLEITDRTGASRYFEFWSSL
jgi:glycosyltransferase involved in cell wall biosynthesis